MLVSALSSTGDVELRMFANHESYERAAVTRIFALLVESFFENG